MLKRAILIDGNNLLFRSYYATAYTGNTMKNSKGFPTNALFGFVNMMNKIINEENPEYIMVAFDKGKNFRHEKYDNYKAGRIETPKELLDQFPIAKEILKYMGIVSLEIDNYEADDIIGTFAKMADLDKAYDATIISSDKDLLQLISDDVDVKLLKQKDYIMMNKNTFFKEYGIEPIRIIDLKALEGDKSDNIPGVKGVGEKTALNLLREYGTLENIYDNIDNIKGKLKDKLIADKDNAFFSKELATIYKDIDFDISFEDLKRKEIDEEKLYNLYEELEFYSFIKNRQKEVLKNIDYKIVEDINDIVLKDEYAFYLEVDNENYHNGEIIGLSLYDGEHCYYLSKDFIINNKDFFKKGKKYTYDFKKSYIVLNRYDILVKDVVLDYLIGAYLLNYNVRDDIAYISNTMGYDILFYENLLKASEDDKINNICLKSKFIYDKKEEIFESLESEKLLDLYKNIEHPLISVLARMEINGIKVSREKLEQMSEEMSIKIDIISKTIYNYAGEEFNISSPKQLGEILFEKLKLPFRGKKKGRNGYSTSHDKLVKLIGKHPIIKCILEYRELTKLKNTYLDTLGNYIKSDGKIHTMFKQTVTRTGRLSSVEPNLQNIPIRNEEGRRIRKAFIPEYDYIVTSDYSQIELRVLAHISNCKDLINAFNSSEDIHTKVASDIFNVPEEAVTKNMRRSAKAVIFGIVYGISSWGLGENLDINANEAKKYIDKYLDLYPGVKTYMNEIVKKSKETNEVRTLFNRKRVIDELSNPNYIIRMQGERIALNTPIQGTSADIIKKAMIEIDKKINELGLKSKMIIQVHDELVFDCVKEEKERLEELVRDIMENTYKLHVPLKVEVDYGSDWYEAK